MATTFSTYPTAPRGLLPLHHAHDDLFPIFDKTLTDTFTHADNTTILKGSPWPILDISRYLPAIVVLCSFSITFMLNTIVHTWFVPDVAKLTSWKWKKTFVSFLHSTVAAVMVVTCFYRVPNMITEPTAPHDQLMQCLLVVVIGYFLYDLIDILTNDPCSATYQLASHHVVIIAMLISFLYTGFAVRAGVVSLAGMVSSVFQESRKVMHILKVPTDGSLYQAVSVINIALYVPLRFGVEAVALRWLFVQGAYLHLHPCVTASVVCTTVTLGVLHAKGILTIINNDFIKHRHASVVQKKDQ